MKISIRRPVSYSHIGRKDNQEDRIYPLQEQVSEASRFFILCDGMGGHENGEVASETVSESLGRFFESGKLTDGIVTDEFFNKGLAAAYDALDSKDNGAVRKMGTTLVFIYLHRKGCLVAHIGDSRIYQIRPGKGLLYQSSDHSLVNELLKIGEITPEEAEVYPQKNVITRAMQPNLERRFKAEIHQLSDIQPGDYFFLCSDGVLEKLTNEKLCSVLSDTALSDTEKMKTLEAIGENATKDNYTAYLIPIDQVESEKVDEKPEEDQGIVMATLVDEAPGEEGKAEMNVFAENASTLNPVVKPICMKYKKGLYFIALTVAAILTLLIFFYLGTRYK